MYNNDISSLLGESCLIVKLLLFERVVYRTINIDKRIFEKDRRCQVVKMETY